MRGQHVPAVVARSRLRNRLAAGVAGLIASFLQAAAAQVLELPASLDARLQPGAFEEMCFELSAGAAVRYAFDADAPLEFNLHWHRGSKVLYPLRSDAVARRAGTYRSGQDEAYCLMWTNRNRAAVVLRARIDRSD
jgi:hypothetical protein